MLCKFETCRVLSSRFVEPREETMRNRKRGKYTIEAIRCCDPLKFREGQKSPLLPKASHSMTFHKFIPKIEVGCFYDELCQLCR